MALSNKLGIYSSLIFLVWITIPPECSSKSLNATSGRQGTTTLNLEWPLEDMTNEQDKLSSVNYDYDVGISGENEPVPVDTYTISGEEPVRMDTNNHFHLQLSEFVTDHFTLVVIISIILELLLVILVTLVIRKCCKRVDEEGEHDDLINMVAKNESV